MIKLRNTPSRFNESGYKIRPPYTLDSWCQYCGMGLVADEFHPLEACVLHVAAGDYERTLAVVADIAAMTRVSKT